MASAEEQSCSDNPQGMITSSPVSQAFNMDGDGHYVPERVYNIDEETRMVPDMPINANATARHAPQGAVLKVATSVPTVTALQPSTKSPSNFSALSFIASEYGESDTSSPGSPDSPTPLVGEQPTVSNPSAIGADGNNSAGFPTAEVSLQDNLETVSMSIDTQCEAFVFPSAENIFNDKGETLVIKTVTESENTDKEPVGVATVEGQFMGKSTAEGIELLLHADPCQNNDESALEPMETEDLNKSSLKDDVQDTSISMSVDMSMYSKEISNMDSILTGADESQSASSMACSTAPKRKGPGAIPFVEYANLSVPVASEGDVSLSNITFIDEGSNQSSSNLTEKSSRPKRSRLEVQDVGFEHQDGLHAFPAEKLFEYQWPQDGGEWYLLQEQVSEYLGVLSFKRKYPDLTRRPCEALEKDFLREKGVVTETQSDLGLTAVRSDEIYDLMLKDYQDKYHEYATVIHEREKQKISTKHKEYEEAQERLEKSKMATYMKKAAKSASDFNRNFLRDRREERTAYFDLQTFRIHYQAGRFKKLSTECTKPSAYPVALMPGQFQDHYCSFTSDELRYLPINTALFDPPKKMKTTLAKPAAESDETGEEKSGSSSESSGSSSSDSENVTGDKNTTTIVAGAVNNVNAAANNASTGTNNSAAAVVNDGTQTPAKTPTKKLLGKTPGKKLIGTPVGTLVGTPVRTPARRGGPGRGKKKLVVSREEGTTTPVTPVPASPAHKKEEAEVEEMDRDKCRICKSAVLFLKYKRVETKMIKCSECGKIAHPSCLDLTEKMIQVVTTYPWQCMECKTCVECMDPYDEDKMLFCDRCDRGYHTFCVGLRCLPTGRWECRSCKGVAEASKIARRGRGRGRGRGSRGGRGGVRSGVAQTADASTETADTSVNTDPFDDLFESLGNTADAAAGSAAPKMPGETAEEPTDVTLTATATVDTDDSVIKKQAASDELMTESGSNNLNADVTATEDRSAVVAEPPETVDLAPQLTVPDVDKTDASC